MLILLQILLLPLLLLLLLPPCLPGILAESFTKHQSTGRAYAVRVVAVPASRSAREVEELWKVFDAQVSHRVYVPPSRAAW